MMQQMVTALGAGLLLSGVLGVSAHAQDSANPDAKPGRHKFCNEFRPPMHEALGKTVGVEDCRIVREEIVFNIYGHRFQRVDIRLSGTVEGWAMKKKGPRYNYFTDGPEFVFAQPGNPGPHFRGIARYEAERGSGMTILYPLDADHWNGKAFLTAHGAGSYAEVGDFIPRDPRRNLQPLANANRYVGLMIDKGYAVVHTLRSSAIPRSRGDITVTLEDGSVVEKYQVGAHAGLILEWNRLAQLYLEKHMGRAPSRTYFYGFSAGGFLGRLINYKPGVNRGPDGGPVIDGFLVDDSGGGLWLPKVIVDDKDVLFATEEDRQAFVKQIDLTHQAYAGDTGGYLHNKRLNAIMLRDKGLGDHHRVYEIRGVSHFDAGASMTLDQVHQTLDLGPLIDAQIDLLDQWVERDVPPPPSTADTPEISQASEDRKAIALPEVACPLGVYHLYPVGLGKSRRGGQHTAFAMFDGINMEPVDGRGELVDMNGNGTRDKRETLTQAWQRLGLLGEGETVDRGRYVACVARSVSSLAERRLLPPRAVAQYVSEAAVAPLQE
ncbi:MAG: hypothetical protein GEU92_12490 [Alphaproteobacteria bacterium]|nr:hypothetical protein [Alphaproteobacteria bacterium]